MATPLRCSGLTRRLIMLTADEMVIVEAVEPPASAVAAASRVAALAIGLPTAPTPAAVPGGSLQISPFVAASSSRGSRFSGVRYASGGDRVGHGSRGPDGRGYDGDLRGRSCERGRVRGFGGGHGRSASRGSGRGRCGRRRHGRRLEGRQRL